MLQFSIQMRYHLKSPYSLPHRTSSTSFSIYVGPHNERCTELAMNSLSLDAGDLLIRDDGNECVRYTEYVRLFCESLLFYFAFFITWLELSCGIGRFFILGLSDSFLYFCYLISVVGMSVQIASWKMMMEEREAFTMWLSIAFMVMIFIHICYEHYIPECKNYANRRIATYIIASLINSVG